MIRLKMSHNSFGYQFHIFEELGGGNGTKENAVIFDNHNVVSLDKELHLLATRMASCERSQ